jgi:hypothetical protein
MRVFQSLKFSFKAFLLVAALTFSTLAISSSAFAQTDPLGGGGGGGGGGAGGGGGGAGLGGGNYSFGLPSVGGPGIRIGLGPVNFQIGGAADLLVEDSACVILGLASGRFAALVMCVAGLIAIVSAAVGAYKIALSTIVVAVGSFILEPVVEMFFGNMCGFTIGIF